MFLVLQFFVMSVCLYTTFTPYFNCLSFFHIIMQISEILDSELLGEGLIPTLQQAHDMLLAENPKTVPYRATTYGQVLVFFSFCDGWNLKAGTAKVLVNIF